MLKRQKGGYTLDKPTHFICWFSIKVVKILMAKILSMVDKNKNIVINNIGNFWMQQLKLMAKIKNFIIEKVHRFFSSIHSTIRTIYIDEQILVLIRFLPSFT